MHNRGRLKSRLSVFSSRVHASSDISYFFRAQSEFDRSTLMFRLSQIALVMAAVILAAVGAEVCNAQRQQTPMNIPTSVSLRLIVTIDGDQEKAELATVELMDAVGSGSAMARKLTDNDGQVSFQTLSGVHRIRITGPNIQEYTGELEITRNETSHLERIRVRRAENAAQAGNGLPGGSVAAVRLNVPAPARKAYEKGTKALREQHWKESREQFEIAIREYPQFDQAYNYLGVVQIQLSDVEAARASFAKAVEINPDFAEAYRNLARISFAQRKYEETDAQLTKSLETDPLNIWALATAANVELIMHKYDEAIVHARAAHGVAHAGLAGVHIVAALALESVQRPSEALKEYQQYLTEEPGGRDAVRAQEAIARLSTTPPK
jgi:Flp pilus assembly protein TadD